MSFSLNRFFFLSFCIVYIFLNSFITIMSEPSYMDNVISRFGHHLSPNQRTTLSDSMVSNLQPTKAGSGYLKAYNYRISSNNASSIKSSPANFKLLFHIYMLKSN
ncbi:hypothetical protein BD770DRAFT_477569 [Pilaira anomala]|nr:hypothetical protein BD770DRAFT_477569 [Pilaira anomala]